MILSKEDKEFIDFAYDCINRARYCSSQQLTKVYNRCFADRVNFTPVKDTSCGSCLRSRVMELKREMDAAIAKLEEDVKVEEPVKEYEITELTPESIEDVKEPPMANVVESTAQPRKKKGRK